MAPGGSQTSLCTLHKLRCSDQNPGILSPLLIRSHLSDVTTH